MEKCWLCCSCLLGFVSLACGGHSERQKAPPADPRLMVSTARAQYLLGEPVPFDLTFRNNSNDVIEVVEVFPDEIPLWIASEAMPFERFPRVSAIAKRDRRLISLRPGNVLNLQFRASVSFQYELAFPKSGDYQVYAVFPLYVSGSSGSVDISSNTVELRVREPQGLDLQVWAKLKDPSFLALLSHGHVNQQKKDVPLEMARVLEAHPKSGYAPAMRYALSKVYFHQRFGLPEKEQESLAKILGITHVEKLSDERLKGLRKESLEKRALLSDILVSLSKYGVTFDASPELKKREASISDSAITLRLSMRSLSDELEASWVRRGGGYFLVPFEADKNITGKGKDKPRE